MDDIVKLNPLTNKVDFDVPPVTLEKSDIMSLIQQSFDKGDAFATSFQKEVVTPLIKKIGTKIKVDDVIIDSEKIADKINTAILKEIKPSFRNVKPEIDMQDIIGLDKTSSKSAKKKTGGFLDDLVKKFKKTADGATFEKDANYSLLDMLGVDKKTNKWTNLRWNGLQLEIIKRAKEAVGKAKFDFNTVRYIDDKKKKTTTIEKDATLKLNDILGLNGVSNAWTNLKWNGLQLDIIKKAKAAVNDVIFELNNVRSGKDATGKKIKIAKVNLRDFLGLPDTTNPWTNLRWNGLQLSIIKQAKKAVDDTEFKFEKKVTLKDFMGIDMKSNFWTKLKWNGLQLKIIEQAKAAIGKMGFDFGGGESQTKKGKAVNIVQKAMAGKGEEEKDKKPGGWKALEKDTQDVNIKSISKESILALKGVMLPFGASVDVMKKKPTGKMSTLGIATMGVLAGLGLVVGGSILGVKTLFDSGPLKGTKAALAKWGTMGGAAIAGISTKVMTNQLGKMTGIFTGTVTKIFGNSKLIGGVGKALSKVGGGLGAKLGGSILGKIFSKVALKKIPLIGSLFSIGSGLSRMKDLDIAGGLLEFGSAIANIASIFPPFLIPGTAISLAIDLFLAKRDKDGGGPKKLGKTGFNKIFVDKFIPMLKKNPLISPLINLGEAIGYFSTGEWKMGLKKLAYSVPIFGNIYEFFTSPENKADRANLAKGTKKVFDFTKMFHKWGAEKITAYFNKAPKWLQFVMKSIPGVGAIVDIAGKVSGDSLSKEADSALGAAKSEPKQSFAQNMLKMGKEKFMALYKKAPRWLKYVLSHMPGVGSFIKGMEAETHEAMPSTPVQAVKPAQKDVAVEPKRVDDFVMHKGQKAQPIHQHDNLIGIKSTVMFDKLISTLSGTNAQNDNYKRMFEEAMRQQAITQKELRGVISKMNELLTSNSAQTAPKDTASGLSHIPESGIDVRDPAYTLRSRTWDRLRTGYAIT